MINDKKKGRKEAKETKEETANRGMKGIRRRNALKRGGKGILRRKALKPEHMIVLAPPGQ